VNNLKAYRGVSPLKKAAMNILVKMADNQGIENLREVFHSVDTNGTGHITVVELKQAMIEAKIPFDEKEIDKIMDEIDSHRAGHINYSEFLAATVSVRNILSEERLKAIFKVFEVDCTGVITAQDIADAMKKFGYQITTAEIQDIMNKHDIHGDGVLSYEEFRRVFQNL